MKKRPMTYEPRTYRKSVTASGLETFEVKVKETDLQIAADRDLSGAALSAVHRIRGILEHFIKAHPDFATTLSPYPDLRREWPHEVQAMIRAGRAARTGPMAAVAGCIAEYVGKSLLTQSSQVMVENGGDVFLHTRDERILAIYAGDSPLSMHLGLKVPPDLMPLGVCTSSGTVGHSLSFGMADAAVVIAGKASLADAVATALGNQVVKPKDIEAALQWAMSVKGVLGAVVVMGDKLGAIGDAVELVKL